TARRVAVPVGRGAGQTTRRRQDRRANGGTMSGRFPFLSCLGLLAVLLLASEARAHRLEAEYRILPSRRVRIESWFDLTGDSAKGAGVKVFRAGGELLLEGRLDDEGIFIFRLAKVEPLRVLVSAGAGHSKELLIPAVDLDRPLLSACVASLAAPPWGSAAVVLYVADTGTNQAALVKQEEAGLGANIPRADRGSQVSIKDVLIGVGFVLALAAFMLSLRNARQLRELKMGASHRPDQRPSLSDAARQRPAGSDASARRR